jgi:hypothetical protein
MLTIQLRAAKIPWIGTIAYHYWFVVHRDDRSDRWEVWQSKTVKSYHPRHLSWGHLHYNLMDPQAGVGNGTSWLATQWEDEEAIQLAQLIEATPDRYPYGDRYFLWPGPNSNTYVQWILNYACCKSFFKSSSPSFRLSWRGWGKDF